MHKRLAILILAALTVACSGVQVGGKTEKEVDSSALENLVLTDLSGREIVVGDYVGKNVIMVSFWATFCKPCKSEMPFLQKLHETYGEQGLKIVSISLDPPETESMVKPLIKRNNYTFQVAIDRQSDAAQLLNTKSVLPFLLVFDRTGKLVEKKDGFSAGDQPKLEKLIKELVAQ